MNACTNISPLEETASLSRTVAGQAESAAFLPSTLEAERLLPTLNGFFNSGGLPEWPKGAGCKPAGLCLRWFKSNTLHRSRLGRFDELNLKFRRSTAGVAQLVERQPSKLNVASSTLVSRSARPPSSVGRARPW